MNKELSALLNATHNCRLRINGAFTVGVNCINDRGLNIDVSENKEVARRVLYLEYTLAHDKLLFTSRELTSPTVDKLKKEIVTAMKDIVQEVSDSLTTQFENGYILGEVEDMTVN